MIAELNTNKKFDAVKETSINIFGSTGTWWAIEFIYPAGRLGNAFVLKTDVKI